MLEDEPDPLELLDPLVELDDAAPASATKLSVSF
jgi:hypothetical protein